jgi:hypothetical protein
VAGAAERAADAGAALLILCAELPCDEDALPDEETDCACPRIGKIETAINEHDDKISPRMTSSARPLPIKVTV